MANKLVINLRDRALKDRAIAMINRPDLPENARVTFDREDKRTLDQNAMLWPLLEKISKEVEWGVNGRHYSPTDWKQIMTAAYRGYETAPGIDGNHLVVLGQSTSRMTKEQFSDLLEIVLAFGATHGVDLGDPRDGTQR